MCLWKTLERERKRERDKRSQTFDMLFKKKDDNNKTSPREDLFLWK